jgi:hypothetical protein
MTTTGFGYRTVQRRSGLQIVPRETFAKEIFPHAYKPGQHVVFGGPSTHGKTYLAFDLVGPLISPDFPVYVSQSKPRDPVTEQRAKQLHLRVVETWNGKPPRRIVEILDEKRRPPGYLIKPKFGNIEKDMQNCAQVTANLLADRYSAGAKGESGILLMDDTMVKAVIMKLDRQMVTIIAMAGAMGIGEWVFIQKPTDSGKITLWAYENATHCFFTKGGDNRMLKRYAEISGDNNALVISAVPGLDQFQFVYLNKDTGHVCIVDKG